MISAFGPEWKPAAVNSTQEFDSLYEGHRQLTDIRSFWIYGTSNVTHITVINTSDYFLDDTGVYTWTKFRSSSKNYCIGRSVACRKLCTKVVLIICTNREHRRKELLSQKILPRSLKIQTSFREKSQTREKRMWSFWSAAYDGKEIFSVDLSVHQGEGIPKILSIILSLVMSLVMSVGGRYPSHVQVLSRSCLGVYPKSRSRE